MAYKTIVSKYCANRQAALDEIYTTMSGMGWELVDGNFSPITVSYTAVNISDETFTTTSGSVPANATPVQITTTGTIPTGLAINTLYYVVSRTDTTFKLSTTYNGSAVNITAQGTGNHTIKEALRVYRSNGENSDKIYEYIVIYSYTVNTIIYFYPAYYWNTTTKVTAGLPYNVTTYDLNTSESGFYLWIYGNKNLVHVLTKISSTYDRMMFGHLNKSLHTVVTTTSSGIATGTGVPVTVASTTGFDLITNYQIIGASGEGRDPINLNSIDGPTQMTITTVARNYAAGALIGIQPSTFGGVSGGATTNWYPTCPQQAAGIATCGVTSNGVFSQPITNTSIDPDYRSNRYLLLPLWMTEQEENLTSAFSAGAYNDEYLLTCGDGGLTQEDTFSVGRLDTGTSSGSNDSTTLNDTTKSWTTNAYAGKVIIITSGTGLGQIKKIASNTTTSITLESGWTFEIVPTTSGYIICDEGYRYSLVTSGLSLASREGC